jgi:hypothetical protein
VVHSGIGDPETYNRQQTEKSKVVLVGKMARQTERTAKVFFSPEKFHITSLN